MVTGVLGRKLRRDMRRQWSQFAAVVVVVAIGIAVFVAASDAYRNLNDSFTRAYANQRLPDVVLAGPRAPATAAAAVRLPGHAAVTVRSQADTGMRIGGHTLLGRVVSVPDRAQPAVSRLVVRSGRLPRAGEVLVEQHIADHYRLRPGDTIELFGTTGWRRVRVAGSALSTEYLWPARSQQEVMTSPEQFGVAFGDASLVSSLSAAPQRQVALYATDRADARALVRAATALGREHGLVVTTRTEQPSFVALDQDVKTFGEFANLLPLLFLAAAILGAFILLSRVVTAQRAVIGTLAANGIAPRTLRRHYLAFGVVAGIAAAPLGLIGGLLLGVWFTTMYTSALGLPLHVTSLHLATLVVGAGAGVLATSVAAWAPARAAARTAPAEAMRVTPTGTGRRSWLEHVGLVRRLPARWRMALRGLVRNRRRAGFTIAGVAVSLSLVLVFAGLRDTVSNILDRQYGTVDRSDGQLYANSGQADVVLGAARADPAVATAEPFARVEAALTAATHRYDTILLGLPTATKLHRFIATDGRPLTLPSDGGLLLGRGLHRLLGVDVGDRVTITTSDGARVTERVVAFVDEPLAAVAYTSLDHLSGALGRPAATGALIALRPGTDRAAAGERLGRLPGAAAYFNNAALEKTLRDAFRIMDVLVGMMLLFAIVMAVALLYNAMSANLAERAVELGTLNAAGVSRGMLGRLVAAENLALTLLGIPIGLVTGIALARWFMSNYENLGYQWELRMQTSTIVLVCVALLAASVASQLATLRGLRRINVAAIVRERSL